MSLFHTRSGFAACAVLCCALIGCHGGEETVRETVPPQPSATEMMQQELQTLRTTKDSLSRLLNGCQQSNIAANQRIADLATQVSALSEKEAVIAATPKNEISSHPKASYLEALDLFNGRKYADAAAIFQAALDDGIQDDLRDNCTYWLGECAYGRKQYTEALEFFKKISTFRISEKKDDAQIMIANCYLRMNNIPKAKEALERLLKVFPASPFVRVAKEKLQKVG